MLCPKKRPLLKLAHFSLRPPPPSLLRVVDFILECVLPGQTQDINLTPINLSTINLRWKKIGNIWLTFFTNVSHFIKNQNKHKKLKFSYQIGDSDITLSGRDCVGLSSFFLTPFIIIVHGRWCFAVGVLSLDFGESLFYFVNLRSYTNSFSFKHFKLTD